MNTLFKKGSLTGLLLLALQGCATIQFFDGVPDQCPEQNKSCEENIVRDFFKPTDKGWEKEKAYLNLDPNERPKLGIAISGGGTRSASFSLGVLKALNEAGVLENVDVISGVSGGAYTTYWYFMQQLYMEDSKGSEDGLFRRSYDAGMNNISSLNESRYQYTLENSSDIFQNKKTPSFFEAIQNSFILTGKVASQFLTVPFHLTTNVLWDWDWNIAPFQYYYRQALEKTYGYAPLDYKLKNFVNESNDWWIPYSVAERVELAEIGDFLEKEKCANNNIKKLPYFIINATGRHGQYYRDKRYINEIFEFTPWSCGSDLFGYVQYGPGIDCGDEVTFSKAVAVSGAALDGQYYDLDADGQLGESSSWSVGHNFIASATEILNLDLGIYIDNYKFLNKDKALAKWHIWGHKVLPVPFFNLHDRFLAGNTTKDSDSISIFLSDGGHSENLGLMALLKRKVKQIIVVDAGQDIKSQFAAAKYINHLINQAGHSFKLKHRNNRPMNVYDATPDEAVIEGEVKYKDNQRSKIIYIKLSAKTSKTSTFPYPSSVESYMKDHPVFPHQSTVDVFYSAEQFRAYRDLGYEIGSRIKYRAAIKKTATTTIPPEVYISPSPGCLTCDGKI